ncbi:MAG: DUF4349 domain-containing protein [Eubacteriaceae bacterium]|jgi:hypothetical protein|nr:DUF4349 domain-containing protein [Eubacteriaceae bacterium]
MKKKLLSIVSILLLLTFFVSGCSSRDTPSFNDQSMPEDAVIHDKSAESTEQSKENQDFLKKDDKLIVTYQVDYLVDNLDDSTKIVKELLKKENGFADSEEVYNSGMEHYFILRVPQEVVESFVDTLNQQLGKPTYLSKRTENVTSSYTDLEARIRMEDAKQARLNELMARAERMEDMIQLENAIAESISHKESMQNELNHMDDSIQYSSIHLRITEKDRVSSPSRVSFGYRVVEAFKGMFFNTVTFIENFIIFLIYLIPVIIVALIIVYIVKKWRKRNPGFPEFKWTRKQKKNEKPQESKAPVQSDLLKDLSENNSDSDQKES